MYTSSHPSSVINTVTLVEGNFKTDPKTNATKMDFLVMYSDHTSGITFGTCPIKESLFGPETMEAFEKFAELVEKDFARLVLEGAVHAKTPGQIGGQAKAESNEGLQLPKGIGDS